ncbi:large conductance mechanosensitive channel protein MscL [Geodermatophilus sp. YIM 151500]|uniref:large conductance mechanosensitive channel protein MscL n=1 Tax=Geodermatophilus sp. YIM 151500 TaxID=2984531 RepID=UPI0021E36ACE|nr:large conductance mechanosensitive channel protein MscL [Geodermatophilus sp. YIM 151500]MCV2489598.1 large conductance mechanosensitive channel protein MscL [Geodermatophilus sp. YIM 151500]
MINAPLGLRDVREVPGFEQLSGFKKFLLRGNVVDLAVAVVIGTAFTMVVNAFAESFLTPLIALVSGGGELGGVVVVDGQEFTYGRFISEVITFVLTAAVVYFVVVLPMRTLLDRRAKEAPVVPAVPTEVELLVEIRDLLRAQQAGAGRAPGTWPPAAG